MPELPEMDTYRQQLSRRIVNVTVTDVQVTRSKSLNISTEAFTQKLLVNQVVRIERRAKHLLFFMATGDVLLLHLMLGGWMFYGTEEEKPDRTIQIELHFGSQRLYFIGLRLGYLHVHDPEEITKILHKLGPEPLEITIHQFRQALRLKRGTLKTTFVDQSFLSGIGNCYSDEICFEAGILPTRRVTSLTEEEQLQLFHSMLAILREAIQVGGYMEEPLFVGDRLTGGYNERCRVYDRQGEPCMRCGQPIVQIELSSRKCFYCANCQS